MNDYLTDDELLNLISEVETNDLVKAPLHIDTSVFEKIDKKKQIAEYRRFRNRVIIAAAAVIVISPVSPKLMRRMISDIQVVSVVSDEFFEKDDVTEISDTKKRHGISDLGKSHFISDYLNGREE